MDIVKTGDFRCSGSICENLNCFWKIEKFSSLNAAVGAQYDSDDFPSEEETKVQWKLELYPGGMNDESDGKVQCHILCRNELEVGLPAKVSFSIRNSDNEAIASSRDEEWGEFAAGESYDTLEIPRSTLLDKLKDDDVVIITAEIIYTRWITATGEMTRSIAEVSPYATLVEDYCNLPKRMKTDVVIVVGDAEIPAHSTVLGARSKVFAAMFERATIESNTRRIEIVDFEVEIVRSMVQFMYSGTVESLNMPLALGLLRIGDKYDLDSLISYCTKFLTVQLDESNVVEVLLAVERLSNCSEIRTEAIRFIYKNLSDDDLEKALSTFKDKPHVLYGMLLCMKYL